MSPLIKIRTDRTDGFGYYENEKYYCILRDATGTALYDKNTNQLVKKFNAIKHIQCVRFWTDHMLFIKTHFGRYYLYDIKQDTIVWEKRYARSRDGQMREFFMTKEGIIYDTDQTVARPDTCCLVKIDPWNDTLQTFEFDEIPRFCFLLPSRQENHFHIFSPKMRICL